MNISWTLKGEVIFSMLSAYTWDTWNKISSSRGKTSKRIQYRLEYSLYHKNNGTLKPWKEYETLWSIFSKCENPPCKDSLPPLLWYVSIWTFCSPFWKPPIHIFMISHGYRPLIMNISPSIVVNVMSMDTYSNIFLSTRFIPHQMHPQKIIQKVSQKSPI